MRRKRLVVASIFVLVSAASFLLWPIEKADYSNCSGDLFCMAEFSSVPGGGLMYLSNLDKMQDTKPEKTIIKQFSNQDKRKVYSFAPLVVVAISLTVGLGTAIIAAIIASKVRFAKR